METNKTMLHGMWAMIAIVGITLFSMFLIGSFTPQGAFFASNAGYETTNPVAICYLNDCEYIGHILPQPNFGPGRVDCNCNGEIKTFQLIETAEDIYYYNY